MWATYSLRTLRLSVSRRLGRLILLAQTAQQLRCEKRRGSYSKTDACEEDSDRTACGRAQNNAGDIRHTMTHAPRLESSDGADARQKREAYNVVRYGV